MDVRLVSPQPQNLGFLEAMDCHISPEHRQRAIADGRCFVITADGQPAGVLRYGLFWDSIPFLNLIFLDEACRGKGVGRKAMSLWEGMMRENGFGMVMTSTQSDEQAQHFYRALGYRDSGCLLLDIPGYEQPSELFFAKAL